MSFTLACPERFLPKACHISGFGTKIKGLKLFGTMIHGDFGNLTAGCTARIVNLKEAPLEELPMMVVCSPRLIPDPCNLETAMQAHHVHFRRSRTASIQCNPGYVMHACALSLIIPDMNSLQMKLHDDTGQH